MTSDDMDSQNDSDSSSGSLSGGVDKAFLKLTFWQTILSLAGLFTGAVALYAALNESQAVREQTAATVWPYVQVMMVDHSDGEEAHFSLQLNNVGVGPAKMRAVKLEVDGKPVREWRSLVESLVGEIDDSAIGSLYGRNTVSRRVLAPGESVAMIDTREFERATALQAGADAGRARLHYCYCSIFDDCWSFAMFSSDSTEPEPVEECPDFGDQSFLD